MWWTAAAWAAAPDREVALVGSSVDTVAVSDEGRAVVGVGGGVLTAMSTTDWEAGTWSGCEVRSAAVTTGTFEGNSLLIVTAGCDDGFVYRLGFDDETDTFEELDSFELNEQNGPVVGMFAKPGSDTLLAVTEARTGAEDPTLHVYAITDGVASTTYGADFATIYDTGAYSDTLFLLTNNGNIYTIADDGTPLNGQVTSLGVGIEDVVAVPGGIYGLASTGVYSATNVQPWYVLVQEYYDAPGGLLSSTEDGWFLLTDGTEAQVWDASAPSGDPVDTFPITSEILDFAAVPDGYAFGAGGSGIAILTANPWVSDLSADVATGTSGDPVTVTFSCEDAVDWELVLGGDRTGNGGTTLDSGSAEAGATVSATVTIDGTWKEGTNLLFVRVTDPDTGLEGYDAARVTIDSPPSTVSFSDADVGFGDESLVVTIRGVDDADLDHYLVYITTESFEAADYPTGGPAYAGPDSKTSPISVKDGVAPGEDVTTTIGGLTNGTTYYLAVRTVDTNGAEGPMSNVAKGTPEQTFTASELAGEEGGTMGCSTTGGAGAGAVLAAMAFLGARRSGRGSRAFAAVIAASGVALAAPAHAADEDGPKRDDTKSYGSFELRYGGYNFDDHLANGTACDDLSTPTGTCAIREVYGSSGKGMLTVGFGGDLLAMLQKDEGKYRPTSVLQADIQLGFLQRLATTVGSSGAASDEKTMITVWPIGVGLKARLHLLDEQILVPYVRAGADVLAWSEKWDNSSGGKDKLAGTKYGGNLAVGGQILLDGIARSRASLLEAQTGVNDTYFTIEYRRNDTCIPWKCAKTATQDESGLSFSGSELTFGLALGF